MNLAGDILKELFGMFLTDARLGIAVLLLVAVVAGLVAGLGITPIIAGGILFFGCLTILIEAISREARASRRR